VIVRYRPTDRGGQPKKKIRGRPFQPGNPGRPRGSKNKTTRLLEELLGDEAEKLTRKAVELALGGNVRCLQFCIDRILPKRNGRPIEFPLPEVNNINDVVKAMAAITTGVNTGSLTAEEAGQLVNVLDAYVKILETRDYATRIEALESRTKETA
jgi:hypothetical protein